MSNTLLLYDQDYKQPNKIYLPFAETNALLKTLGEQPIIHFWTMDQTVILGMSDQRLPNLPAGLSYLTEQIYPYFVRNSGGLAVVCDSEVLNISLFLPRKKYDLSINEAYQLMADLIQDTFPDKKMDVKEIPDSYCPGDFDLSIDGKKFAGISQRRTTNGIVVMIYLSITGNQDNRSNLIKHFYEVSNNPPSQNFSYPEVDPQVMDNLDQLLDEKLSVEEVKEKILTTLSPQYQFDSQQVSLYTQTNEYQDYLTAALEDLAIRNEKIIDQR
ncbi:lipoate--protein ligase family protein [Lactobacillus sp. YT155]|uniref:lipoate--protein ligase family protein n=1 Tax=Lactobacillus sp. YT155 TaxID=3060955 RepID=UPI0026600AD2|nr:lipoate--protein ligase family protein [Lactobacillus sp. YT155]MDO1604612.1 lipoate--protein ligase family protein [Lactobacillus sp. YT155]